MCSFYENLYTFKNIDSNDIVHYLNEVNCPTLTQCDKDMCDAIPTMVECKAAVNYMKMTNHLGLMAYPANFTNVFVIL